MHKVKLYDCVRLEKTFACDFKWRLLKFASWCASLTSCAYTRIECVTTVLSVCVCSVTFLPRLALPSFVFTAITTFFDTASTVEVHHGNGASIYIFDCVLRLVNFRIIIMKKSVTDTTHGHMFRSYP